LGQEGKTQINLRRGNIMNKYEYLTDEHRAKMRTLFNSTVGGITEAKDTFLDGMTEYVYRRLDAERNKITQSGEYAVMRRLADRRRDKLVSQICERQREKLNDLEHETSLYEAAVVSMEDGQIRGGYK
jgi:hypothetical protein